MNRIHRLGVATGLCASLCAAPGAAAAAFVRNPSFESNYEETWPHYSPIDEWTGGSGVNDATGPFHNSGTPVPDRDRVGFKQGGGDVTQDIAGLTPNAVYWLQFFYDGRRGGGSSESLVVKWNDTEIGRVPDLKPSSSGYYFMSAPFVPDTEAGTIRFTHVVSGDRTLLLDGVNVVARSTNDVVLRNPSFEASGALPAVGAITQVAGWNQSGSVGVDDGSGGRANNGTIPDQDLVAYLEGNSSLTQKFDGLIPGNEYELRLAVNAKTGTAPNLRIKLGEAVLLDQAVTPGAYQNLNVKFSPAITDPTLTLAQTKDGADVLLIDDVRLLGTVKKPLPPMVFAPLARESSPGQTLTFTLSVPAEALATGPVDIRLESSSPDVATLVGAAADRSLTLHFDAAPGAKAPVERSFGFQTLARGSASINVLDAAKIPFAFTPSVNVVGSLVKNASFESNPAGAFPGLGEILAWEGTGNVGLNATTSPADPAPPFGDNGLVPDREQVAFIQGNGSLAQDIVGLTAGQSYWLQFYYNARNCCGERTQKLTVKFAGQVLTEINNLKPAADAGEVNYAFASLPFVASGTAGRLEFISDVTGDATVVLDAVNIVARAADEIVVRNPSFEASGSPPGVGYLQPFAMAGWDSSPGGRGINVDGEGPFTDNGDVPDQDRAAFLQNTGGFLSQTLSGLVAGQKYTVVVALNARNCCGGRPLARVSVNDEPLFDDEIAPVGGPSPYVPRYLPFIAAGTEATLKLELSGPDGSDVSLLLDDVHVVHGERSAPSITVQPVGVAVDAGANVVLEGAASGSGLRYEWRRNGVALTEGGRVSGARTTKLTITAATAADAGAYLLAVTDGLGVVGSDVATVEVAAAEVPLIIIRRHTVSELEITSEPQPLPEGFVLQTASSLAGPWSDLAEGNTPLTVPVGTESARFLRARKP